MKRLSLGKVFGLVAMIALGAVSVVKADPPSYREWNIHQYPVGDPNNTTNTWSAVFGSRPAVILTDPGFSSATVMGKLTVYGQSTYVETGSLGAPTPAPGQPPIPPAPNGILRMRISSYTVTMDPGQATKVDGSTSTPACTYQRVAGVKVQYKIVDLAGVHKGEVVNGEITVGAKFIYKACGNDKGSLEFNLPNMLNLPGQKIIQPLGGFESRR